MSTPKVPNINMVMKPIAFFKPYPFNPRDNKDAVDSVAESIKSFGFLVPIVADENGEIAAGHTRHQAALKLKMKNVPTVIASHLTPQQLQAFRLIDNKVSELAVWDFDLLAKEIAELTKAGFELTPYGWSQEEIDCLADMVSTDCLSDVQEEADGVMKAKRDPRTGKGGISDESRSVRIAIGAFNFFVLKEDYEAWADALRKKHNYDNAAVVEGLAIDLGLLAGVREYRKLHDEKQAAASTAIAEVKEKQAIKRRVVKQR